MLSEDEYLASLKKCSKIIAEDNSEAIVGRIGFGGARARRAVRLAA